MFPLSLKLFVIAVMGVLPSPTKSAGSNCIKSKPRSKLGLSGIDINSTPNLGQACGQVPRLPLPPNLVEASVA